MSTKLAQYEILSNYDNHSIRKLESIIKKNGFVYKLVKRENDKCIYSQHNGLGLIVAYEVFLTKFGDNKKAKERWAKLKNQPFNPNEHEDYYEVYPSDEEFGKRAWSYKTLERAIEAYEAKCS